MLRARCEVSKTGSLEYDRVIPQARIDGATHLQMIEGNHITVHSDRLQLILEYTLNFSDAIELGQAFV
jgi:hypothetical protein